MGKIFCRSEPRKEMCVINAWSWNMFIIIIMWSLYRVFMIICLKKPHISRAYNFAAVLWLQSVLHVMLFPMINVLYLYLSTLWSICTVPRRAVFSSSLVLCFPDIFWMILRRFQLPQLLLVSVLFLYFTCTLFLLYDFYILETPRLLSWSRFCLLKLQNLSINEGWNFNSGNYLFTTDTK